MIDRKTALVSAALIALMLAGAAWRIVVMDEWPLQQSAALLFVPPACAALVAGILYCTGRRATAVDAKLQPWFRWGQFVSICYCAGVLLLQGLLIVQSLGFHMPLDASAIRRALGVLIGAIGLFAVNQMPKLPWFERRFSLGGELGPIYGPRYMRTQSRILAVFMLAVIASLAFFPPALMRYAAPSMLIATACLFAYAITSRRHLGRKWKLEQARGMEP